MLSDIIEDSEFLYRRVILNPDYWKVENGISRPSSAVFKDSQGMSVDRQGDRNISTIDNEVIDEFTQKYQIKAIVKFTAQKSREIGAYPKYVPLEGNIYHSEIHDSETKIELSNGKARQLSKSAEIIWERSTE